MTGPCRVSRTRTRTGSAPRTRDHLLPHGERARAVRRLVAVRPGQGFHEHVLGVGVRGGEAPGEVAGAADHHGGHAGAGGAGQHPPVRRDRCGRDTRAWARRSRDAGRRRAAARRTAERGADTAQALLAERAGCRVPGSAEARRGGGTGGRRPTPRARRCGGRMDAPRVAHGLAGRAAAAARPDGRGCRRRARGRGGAPAAGGRRGARSPALAPIAREPEPHDLAPEQAVLRPPGFGRAKGMNSGAAKRPRSAIQALTPAA